MNTKKILKSVVMAGDSFGFGNANDGFEQVMKWNEVAALAPCHRADMCLDMITNNMFFEFECPDSRDELELEQLMLELQKTGLVRCGLTFHEDELRFCLYFPSRKKLKSRLRAAYKSIGREIDWA